MLRFNQRRSAKLIAAVVCLLAMAVPASARPASIKRKAFEQFNTAQKMREALNGQPGNDRSKREYQRVMDAYRQVYYMAPTSVKADASVVAVAELLVEMGRAYDDEKALRAAIGQYEFLRREYPGSKYRFDALFTIGQIYREDLGEADKARDTFSEFARRYPHHRLARDAQDAITEMDQEEVAAKKGKKPEQVKKAEAKAEPKLTPPPASEDTAPPKPAAPLTHAGLPFVTGIRYWSTPNYTRVAIDLETEVKYEAGRVPDPDRIFFDLHDTKLASTLVGKSFDVSDGFLRRIRVAQFQRGLTRVVLEVDDVSDYSAFLLPNPYRLIIDIHGRKQQTLTAKNGKPAKPDQKSDEEPAAPRTNDQQAKTTPPAEAKPKAAEEAKNEKTPAAPESKKAPTQATGTEPAKSARTNTDENADEDSGSSTKQEVANLKGPEKRATDKPTTEPTVAVVAPRAPDKQRTTAEKPRNGKRPTPDVHVARPTQNGDRSLIRALGLKIGKIVVDAGHGGHDTGTIGPSGLLEKDLVLDVALRLGRLLEKGMGADVVYTRDDDTFVPLETRTAVANKAQADLFISVHANSSHDPSARGLETYYLNFTSSADALEVAARENAVSEKSIHELQDLVKKIALKEKIEESREFAQDVQRSLVTGLAAKDRTLRDRGVKKAPFIVLIGANMPSILAEISFVSNPNDERRLQTPEYRQKIAESLYKGVQRYVSGLSGVKLATKAEATTEARNGGGQQ